MPHLSWHDYLMVLSFFASIAGLILLLKDATLNEDEVEITDRVLFIMSFTYWLVYCVAFAAQKLILPEWEILSLSVKITAVLSYLLTCTCILSLPLHRVATRQPE